MMLLLACGTGTNGSSGGTGGSTTSGGAGGATSTGGTASGGTSTGGNATGGAGTGGTATGGNSTGGTGGTTTTSTMCDPQDPAACDPGMGCFCGGPGASITCGCGSYCKGDLECTDPLKPVCCGGAGGQGICTDACSCYCD